MWLAGMFGITLHYYCQMDPFALGVIYAGDGFEVTKLFAHLLVNAGFTCAFCVTFMLLIFLISGFRGTHVQTLCYPPLTWFENRNILLTSSAIPSTLQPLNLPWLLSYTGRTPGAPNRFGSRRHRAPVDARRVLPFPDARTTMINLTCSFETCI